MIVVFAIDTSPSMGQPIGQSTLTSHSSSLSVSSSQSPRGMSRLDLAKMAVESLTKLLDRRVHEHNHRLLQATAIMTANNNRNKNGISSSISPAFPVSPIFQHVNNLGLGFVPPDQFLLLSTGVQKQEKSQHGDGIDACGAGGRLLVGFPEGGAYQYASDPKNQSGVADDGHSLGGIGGVGASNAHIEFDSALKKLKATEWRPNPESTTSISSSSSTTSSSAKSVPFPEDGGGAAGLNAALSTALQLLSRYRLRHRLTENFGLGRLPSNAILTVQQHNHHHSHNVNNHLLMHPFNKGSTLSGATSNQALGAGLQQAGNALQPASIILFTDGECLGKPKDQGGGDLQLMFGNAPLREFYCEPFRWDQRIFCINVGTLSNNLSKPLHPSLRAFCDVTGGCHISLTSPSAISHVTNMLTRIIAPPLPRQLPLPNPIQLPSKHTTLDSNKHINSGYHTKTDSQSVLSITDSVFVNGGPICSFQQLELLPTGEVPPICRALLLYVPHENESLIPEKEDSTNPQCKSQAKQQHTNNNFTYQPPIWCIPESFFPNKKLETLPPRTAQPLLHYSVNYKVIGCPTFDPLQIMNSLQRLDHLIIANKQLANPNNNDVSSHNNSSISRTNNNGIIKSNQNLSNIKLLQRDVYICEWLSQDGKHIHSPQIHGMQEYFPVCVRGSGRPSLSGDTNDLNDNMLNIAILHVPRRLSTLASMTQPKQQSSQQQTSSSNQNDTKCISTLTFLPPEPQILMNLLIRAAEIEHRMLKKASSKQQQQINVTVNLDEQWRNKFRAYLFRIPPYYQPLLRRCLRSILPNSALALLQSEHGTNVTPDTIALQCFSRSCLAKIRNGEQFANEANERIERREEEIRWQGSLDGGASIPLPIDGNRTSNGHSGGKSSSDGTANLSSNNDHVVGYGHYDIRGNVESYLSSLRNMPPPWRMGIAYDSSNGDVDVSSSTDADDKSDDFVSKCLGDLPSKGLLAFYESRRRWIFGGSGLTTRGLSVEGVNNDGSNSHHFSANHSVKDESLLALADVGASTMNKATIGKMGDFRERLLWSRQPMVGYGANDSTGSAATTAADGSPIWSVDNDALPLNFFDPTSGEFIDSIQARVKSRTNVNFGNPYKDRRGDSLVPLPFLNQRPTLRYDGGSSPNERSDPLTPPGSPPHGKCLDA